MLDFYKEGSRMNVLKGLWRGEIAPIERSVRPGSDYQKASLEICKQIDCFLEKLSPEEKKRLEAINDLQNDMTMLEAEDAFIRGFRLGAKMMMDVVGDYRGQFINGEE